MKSSKFFIFPQKCFTNVLAVTPKILIKGQGLSLDCVQYSQAQTF